MPSSPWLQHSLWYIHIALDRAWEQDRDREWDQWVLIFDVKMFPLTQDRGRDQNPLFPTVPAPFPVTPYRLRSHVVWISHKTVIESKSISGPITSETRQTVCDITMFIKINILTDQYSSLPTILLGDLRVFPFPQTNSSGPLSVTYDDYHWLINDGVKDRDPRPTPSCTATNNNHRSTHPILFGLDLVCLYFLCSQNLHTEIWRHF